MEQSKRQDYRVFETTNRIGKTMWEVKSGGIDGDVVTRCDTLEVAEHQATELNKDKYYFERLLHVPKSKSIVRDKF